MKISTKVREKINKYSLMIAWWQMNEEDKDMKKKLDVVLEKIEETEDGLRKLKVDAKTFEEILKRAKKFVRTPIGEMSKKQFKTLIRLLYGQKTEIEPVNRWELNRYGAYFFDPIKHASWAKHKRSK